MHVFNVDACRALMNHDVRVVSLYPKKKCSFPARSSYMCYHILGVKFNLGAQETGSSKEKTYTQHHLDGLYSSEENVLGLLYRNFFITSW